MQHAHPNPRLIGCVMIARAIGSSSHAAHRMPHTTIWCVAGYKIEAFPATPNFFPRIRFLRQLWSMSSWAPLLCRFPDFYTIIVYTLYPIPRRVVTQPKSWFHTLENNFYTTLPFSSKMWIGSYFRGKENSLLIFFSIFDIWAETPWEKRFSDS